MKPMLTKLKQRLALIVVRYLCPVLIFFHRRFPHWSIPTAGLLARFTFLSHALCDRVAERKDLLLAQAIARQWLEELLTHPDQRAPHEIAISTRTAAPSPDAHVLHTVLEETLNVLDSAGLEPFICFGLLLGYIREGDFLSHDSDLDLGFIWQDGLCEKLSQLLTSHGFSLLHVEPDPWPSRIKACHRQHAIPLDILFFRASPPWVQTYTRICGHPIIRNRTPFELKTVRFRGIEVRVPYPPEQFLSENYGNWQEPSSWYDYILSSLLTDFSDPAVRYYYLRRLANAVYMHDTTGIQELLRIGRKHYPEESLLHNPYWNTNP